MDTFYKTQPKGITMREIDILELFYQRMKARGVTRSEVFLNIDESTVAIFNATLRTPVTLEEVQHLTDFCIANEWLERTTADPHYNFLSLTENGLQYVLNYEY